MKKLFLILLFTSFAILRFYNARDFFFWHIDEDVISLTVKRILVDLRPQLIGFPIPGGVYLGPLIYYVLSIPYIIVLMNPLGLPLVGAAFGTAATFLVYKVGKTIFEKETIGIFAAIIFGFSYLVNAYGRILTGLSVACVLALITYYLLYRNVRFKKPRDFFLLGLVLILASQNEGTSISLIPLSIMILFIYHYRVNIKHFFRVLLLFLSFHIPLLIFDLRHNFFLTNSTLGFLSRENSSSVSAFDLNHFINALMIFPNALSRIILVSGEKDIANQILPCNDLVLSRISLINPSLFILAALFLGIFIIQKVNTKKEIGKTIIFVHLLILIFGILFFNLFLTGYSYEWITVIFFPGFAFICAYVMDKIFQKNLGGVFISFCLLVFVFLNVQAIFMGTGHFGLANKAGAVRYAISQTNGQPFSVDSLGSCYAQGYVYLLWYFGQMPSKVRGLIFDQSAVTLNTSSPFVGIVFVNPSRNESPEFWQKYNRYKSFELNSKKIDDIEIIIVPPEVI